MGLHHQGELQSQYQQLCHQYQAQQQLVQLLVLQPVIMLHIINITNIIKTSAINKVQQLPPQPTMQVSVCLFVAGVLHFCVLTGPEQGG